MSWSAVSVVTKPTAYPVTLAEAKHACRVLHADDDPHILSLVAQSVAELDGPDSEGVALMAQTWRLTLDCFPPKIIRLPGWPVSGVTSINYRDTTGAAQVMPTADYRVVTLSEPVRIEADSWPSTDTDIGAVWVDYTVGHASASDVPEDLRGAVLARVQTFYDPETYKGLDQFIQRTFGRYRRGTSAA